MVAGGGHRAARRRAVGMFAAGIWLVGILFGLPGEVSPSAQAAPAIVPPKAAVLSVERIQRPRRTVVFPGGAGVRGAPQHAGAGEELAEGFNVQWFAHSPGIPPGVVLMLETVTERQDTIRNYVKRPTVKSEGHQRTSFEIPLTDTQQRGRVRQWRFRIVWRGRVLAEKTSEHWNSNGR